MSTETKEPATPQTIVATSAANSPAWLELPGGAKFSIQSACSIGRSSSSQVALKDEKISRCHALINARLENEYWLSDLGSSNGTYLNGGRLAQAVRIYDQDQIRVGHQIFDLPPARRGYARAHRADDGHHDALRQQSHTVLAGARRL